MRILKFFALSFLVSIFSSAKANVDTHFATIKSDPKALYTFFKEMPKGGELHYHLAGGAYPEAMLALATKTNYCLNSKNQIISKTLPCDDVETLTLAKKPELHPTIIRAWSMEEFTPTQESAHDHFFASFLKFMPIVIDFSPQLLAEVLQRAASQHELYLEIMIMPDNGKAATFSSLLSDSMSYAEKQRVLLADNHFQENLNHTVKESNQILQQARQELGCSKRPQAEACSITVKFQYYILREQSLNKVFAQALNGFAAANISKDIVGVNLVQAEDGAISLRNYQQQMQIFKFLHAAYPNVKIALHAGELTPALVPSTELNFHIHDAIFIGHANRIGHGVDITHEKEPESLLKHMASKPIPVEINLTSNRKILNITGKEHPLNYYLAHHVPVVLSTDDEGVLRTNLTHEYVEAVINQHLDYASIKTINRNALTYSFLPGENLWVDPSKHIPIPACLNLTSLTCHKFIKKNEKARLQWKLEKKLAAFERKFNTSFLRPASGEGARQGR